MLKIVGFVAAALLVAICAILVLAAMKPDTFRVERTASIKAAPERIYPLLDDFKAWRHWSPYEKKDPHMKRALSGPSSGKGAVYAWEGDKNVGSGRIEIAEAAPPQRLTIRLDMIKPIAAHNIVDFTLKPRGEATDVTWAMSGRASFPAKIMHVLFDVDRMVGGDFEAGLASLKVLAER